MDLIVTKNIDDGTGDWSGIGGGGSIPHEGYLTRDEWDDIYDSEFLNFPERRHKFFYCIFAHRNDNDDPRDKEGTLDIIYGESRGYKGFVVYDDIILTKKGQENNFMHELGHNLLGYCHEFPTDDLTNVADLNSPNPSSLNGNNRNAIHLRRDPDAGQTSDRWLHCPDKSCIMKKQSDNLKYCNDCWESMYLSGSLTGWPWP